MARTRALCAVGAVVALACATATTSARPPARTALGAGAAGTAVVEEWQLHATHLDQVPETVLRSAAAVKIAVIDTGADVTAPDLAARSPETWNTRTRTADVRDANGHGTFVASLVAAASGDAKLLVIKSGSDGGTFTDIDEAAAIVYAVDHGALVVTAVGNQGQSGDPVEYPAALVQPVGSNGVGGTGLAVTASTADGSHPAFANAGSWVSLAAPGEHVLGALSSDSSPLLFPRTALPGVDGLYGYGSGTSFAAPLVAGAAALVWGANPALTAQQVAQTLKATASGNGVWTAELGYGVINAAAAVGLARGALRVHTFYVGP